MDEPPRPRHTLKRRITRPSLMLELEAGSPVGEYEIQAQIGEGAMGTVYSAVHPLIGKAVAIKVLKPELCANQQSIDRFVQEAQAVNQIGHPNIVDVFALGELPDGRAYFVMEWLRGEDLKIRLGRGPLAVQDTCDILDGIARALEAAHAKHIVHRDLKPDNVFLHKVDDGPIMVKLLDFGIAKLTRAKDMEKTQTGNMLGTPRYISPEQARGVDVDHRADIYSLGVMAFEMLAGRAPFQGETAMDLVVKHLGEEPPALGQFARVPRALENCVMRMLEKDPADRPSLEVVRQILVDPNRRHVTLPKGLGGRVRTRRLAIGAAVVGALGLGVMMWWLVRPAPSATQPVASGVAPVLDAAPAPEVPEPVEVAEPVIPEVVAPEPVALTGSLIVNVTGAKRAVIKVDGKRWGRGKAVEIEPGSHEVLVIAKGRDPIRQQVEIVAGQANTVAVVVPAARKRVPRPRPRVATPPDDDGLLTPKKRTR